MSVRDMPLRDMSLRVKVQLVQPINNKKVQLAWEQVRQNISSKNLTTSFCFHAINSNFLEVGQYYIQARMSKID